ncbi:MAG: outer membrane lipoprotein-sorting protein [Methylococcales bacterium]|nr:outer membrane lipoprotein-sorting protein [Methylococcales bacterium]
MLKLTKLISCPIICLSMSIISPPAFAEDLVAKGLNIAKKVDFLDTGYEDLSADMEMILRNRQGKETRRKMRNKTLEYVKDGDKSLMIFDSPKDVKGTALLTFSHKKKSDDQWLYLPVLKRVKRISSSNKSGPFMGSEFAYEDLSSQEVEKYTYKFIKDEMIDNQNCFVIERKPRYKRSGYKRQLLWISQKIYQPLKIDFFDRKNTLLKTLIFKDYKQYSEKFWRASELFMQNHQNGKSTTLKWNNYQFKNGYKSSHFSKNSLKRLR